jgi:hypothetical protein
VVAPVEIDSRATRLRVNLMENAGTALDGFSTWTPGALEAVTTAL